MFKKFRKKIGIIGAGNMGSAIAERIKRKYRLFIFDKDKDKINRIGGIELSQGNAVLVEKSDVIILAVKPQDFDFVLGEIKNYCEDKLFVSIAAGIATNYIEKQLGGARVVRVMPNIPARIGKGVSCLCKGKFSREADLKFVKKIFSNLGETLILKEEMMDAATAIFGSGPGYFYYFLEANSIDYRNIPKDKIKGFINELTDTAVLKGFNRNEAVFAVKAMVEGSGSLLAKLNLTPAELKKQVASKGGTTEAALEVLEKGGTLAQAVEAAEKKSKELSR